MRDCPIKNLVLLAPVSSLTSDHPFFTCILNPYQFVPQFGLLVYLV